MDHDDPPDFVSHSIQRAIIGQLDPHDPPAAPSIPRAPIEPTHFRSASFAQIPLRAPDTRQKSLSNFGDFPCAPILSARPPVSPGGIGAGVALLAAAESIAGWRSLRQPAPGGCTLRPRRTGRRGRRPFRPAGSTSAVLARSAIGNRCAGCRKRCGSGAVRRARARKRGPFAVSGSCSPPASAVALFYPLPVSGSTSERKVGLSRARGKRVCRRGDSHSARRKTAPTEAAPRAAASGKPRGSPRTAPGQAGSVEAFLAGYQVVPHPQSTGLSAAAKRRPSPKCSSTPREVCIPGERFPKSPCGKRRA